MADEAKILQIMPASGWTAVYEDEDSVAVVCFALVQGVDEEGRPGTEVRPMACVEDTIEFCDEYEGYLGVVRDDEADEGEEEEE